MLVYWEHKLHHCSFSKKQPTIAPKCLSLLPVHSHWLLALPFVMFYFAVALKIHLVVGNFVLRSSGIGKGIFVLPGAWSVARCLWFVGMPPPVGPRPGMPPMTQAQPVTAPGILNRPPAPAATAPTPQPPVTKPLFPSAGQVRYPRAWILLYFSNCHRVSSAYLLLRMCRKLLIQFFLLELMFKFNTG